MPRADFRRYPAGSIIVAMQRTFGIMMIVGLAQNAFADDRVAVPAPVSTDWAGSLLLVIVWLLVAAAVIGPVARFFRIGPRSAQVFTENRQSRGS